MLQPLRIALKRLVPNAHQLVPEHIESLHKMQFLGWLAKLKNSSKVTPLMRTIIVGMLSLLTFCDRLSASAFLRKWLSVPRTHAESRLNPIAFPQLCSFTLCLFDDRLHAGSDSQPASPEAVPL